MMWSMMMSKGKGKMDGGMGYGGMSYKGMGCEGMGCGGKSCGGKGKGKEMPGDWYCPVCNDLNFARNTECRKCNMQTVMCAVHGKKRSQNNLEDDGMGGLRCKPGMECQ